MFVRVPAEMPVMVTHTVKQRSEPAVGAKVGIAVVGIYVGAATLVGDIVGLTILEGGFVGFETIAGAFVG